MKHITKLFGLVMVAAFIGLVTTPSLFAQANRVYINPSTPETILFDDCNNADVGCSFQVALARVLVAQVDEVFFRVRRAGGTVVINKTNQGNDPITILSPKKFFAHVRGGTTGVRGTIEFRGSTANPVNVVFGASAKFSVHEDATVLFNEIVDIRADVGRFPIDTETERQGSFTATKGFEFQGSPAATFDTLDVRQDLLFIGSEAVELKVKQLTVREGNTLTINNTGTGGANRFDLQIELSTSDDAESKEDEITIDGTIAGTGRVWITPANGTTLRETFTYMPNEDGEVDHEDCLMLKGKGAINNTVYVVGAGNVCVSLSKIGGLDALTNNRIGTADTTNVIFTGDVMVDGDVTQRRLARVVFEGATTITGSVSLLDAGIPDNVDLSGLPLQHPTNGFRVTVDECMYDPDAEMSVTRGMEIPGVQFEHGVTIGKDLIFDMGEDPTDPATQCPPQVLFMGPAAVAGEMDQLNNVVLTSSIEGNLDFKDGGHLHLHGDSLKIGIAEDAIVHTSSHNLELGGDIYSDVGKDGEITMGLPATSTIDAKCATDFSLGTGNRLTLTGGENKDHVISPDMLNIPTLVALGTLEVQGGTLEVTTLHIADELLAGGSLGEVTGIEHLILQGSGVDGSISAPELKAIAYGTHLGDKITLPATLETLALDLSPDRELRITEKLTVNNLGLCSGNLTLVEVENSAMDSTLTVTEFLHVQAGNLVFDEDDPGSIATDMADPADPVNDGYILRYVTPGERTVGSEWFAPRKVVVDHESAKITVGEAKVIPDILHLFKGEMDLEADLEVNGQLLVDKGTKLLSMGNNVVTHNSVTVGGTLQTDGGEVHVLGHNDKDGHYVDGTATVNVGAEGMIDVGSGALQLGPEIVTPKDGLFDDWQFPIENSEARPHVKLDLAVDGDKTGRVTGTIRVPKGSKQTELVGENFDTIDFDGSKNPGTTEEQTGKNWDGTLYLVASGDVVMVDSLMAAGTGGAVEFREGQKAIITKNVASSSAILYVEEPSSLEFMGDLSISGTGGLSVRGMGKSIIVHGHFMLNSDVEGSVNMHDPEGGVFLIETTQKTVKGDFIVSGEGSALRYSASGADLVLEGDSVKFSLKEKDYVFGADIEFAGKKMQTVNTPPDSFALGHVTINNRAGVMLMSDVTQGAAAELTLATGLISSNENHSWGVMNSTIEENLIRRTSAREGMHCGPDNDEACSASIREGSRRSYVTTSLARRMTQGNDGDGELTGGYLFPVGDLTSFRPVIVQLPFEPLDADTLALSTISVPAGDMPAWPADNLIAQSTDGSITLDVYSDIFWKAEVVGDGEMSGSINLRVAATGLVNVFDASRLRIVQWDCEWENPRLAGQYDVTGTASSESFVVNDYINGALNITQEQVDLGNCAIFGIASNGIENPIHREELTAGLSEIQFIHNAVVPAPVNLILDDVELRSGFEFQSATGYTVVAAGPHVVRVTAVGVPEEQLPDPETLPNLQSGKSYVAVVHGALPKENIRIAFFESRKVSSVENMVEAVLVHGVPNAPDVTVYELDPFNDNVRTRLLTKDLGFGATTQRYLTLEPGFATLLVTDSDDAELAAFQLDLSGRQGEALILNFSNTPADLQIYGVDVNGETVGSFVVTNVDTAQEIPTEFALHGNYPNPFNPSTQITFDLPESAQVSLQVIDMLGREVMTLPAKEFEAGANRSIELNAINLSSGAYLYRMIATGAESQYVKTGRMTLVK